MAASNNQNHNNSNAPPMLNSLLAVATQAQGDRQLDPARARMSTEDRAWLEHALSHIAADSDPVKKLKQWMVRLEEVGKPSDANLGDINDILEEIGDLVCDLDLAQYFCSLDGLALIQRLLDVDFEPCNALLVHLVGVLAQYNQKVQQLMVRSTTFLEHCLSVIVDSENSMDYRHKCVGAISAMVKEFLPGLINFVQLDGPDKLMRCFDAGLELDSNKLAHRCAVAAIAMRRSFSVEVVNVDSNFRRVVQCPNEMRAKLLERNAEGRWNDTLEFLAD